MLAQQVTHTKMPYYQTPSNFQLNLSQQASLDRLHYSLAITQLDTYVREIPIVLIIGSFVCNFTIVQLGVYPASK